MSKIYDQYMVTCWRDGVITKVKCRKSRKRMHVDTIVDNPDCPEIILPVLKHQYGGTNTYFDSWQEAKDYLVAQAKKDVELSIAEVERKRVYLSDTLFLEDYSLFLEDSKND